VTLKTAIRISTFWWTLALLIGAIAPMRARASDASSASPPGCVTTIYRYDVRVAVHREVTNSLPPAFAGGGTTQKVTGWKASWVAPVSVVRCVGDVTINIPAVHDAMHSGYGVGGRLHGGQFDRTFDWNDATKLYGYTKKLNANDTTKRYAVPPCHYTYASHVPAAMYLGVGNLVIGQTSFDFFAADDISDEAASKAEFEREADAKYAACDDNRHRAGGGYTPIGDTGMPLDGFSGMLIGDDQLHLTFGMPPNSPVKASILDALVAGKGFNYDTGLQFYQHKAGDWNVSESVRATVSFSPTGSPSNSTPTDTPGPQPGKEPCDHGDFGMWQAYLSYCASYTQHYHSPDDEAALAAKLQQLSAQHEADRKRCGYGLAPFHCGKPPDCTQQLQKIVNAGDPYKLQRQGWHPPTCPIPQPVQPALPASCLTGEGTDTIINYLSGACDEYNKQLRSYKQELQNWERQCSDDQFRDYQQRAADMRKNPQNYVSDPRCKQGQGPTG
jgi:hypothetical protein